MIEYRPIVPPDVDTVVALALRALPANGMVRVSPRKVRAMVEAFSHPGPHFNAAAFEGDECVAGVGAWIAEMPFHERAEAHVVFCYSEHPGAGVRILRSLLGWANHSHAVQRVVWPLNAGADPRIADFAKRRLGFTDEATVLIQYKEPA